MRRRWIPVLRHDGVDETLRDDVSLIMTSISTLENEGLVKKEYKFRFVFSGSEK